jgi:cytosine/adenosine deaminase-related metal-dependent hydrolase
MIPTELRDCIVLAGPTLEPRRCARFAWADGRVTALELGEPVGAIDAGAWVVIPGLTNGHTHMGDSAFPDGATGLTLEQGFFRPHGFKYRELAKLDRARHLPHVIAHLQYMARTGTIRHLDFREQGAYGSGLLRAAARETGVDAVILGQFTGVPFNEEELAANGALLPEAARRELEAILAVAEGFSESTMNDLTDPAWRQIREETERRGKLRAIHCLESPAYRDVSLGRCGRGDLVRAIELYDPHLVVHLTVANPEEIALLAASGKTGVLNPRANAALGLPPPPVRDLMEAGINLLLGTDNGMLNSPNLFAEMDFTYKLAKSQYGDAIRPDPTAILRMATANVEPLGLPGAVGHLAVGAPASFVVLDFEQPHLRSSRHLPASVVTRVTPEDVLATYRAGHALFATHRFHAPRR